MAGQPVGGRDEYHLDGTFTHQIPQSVQRRPIQAGTTIPIIYKEEFGWQLIPALSRGLLHGLHLATNAFLLFLAIRRDPGIRGR